MVLRCHYINSLKSLHYFLFYFCLFVCCSLFFISVFIWPCIHVVSSHLTHTHSKKLFLFLLFVLSLYLIGWLVDCIFGAKKILIIKFRFICFQYQQVKSKMFEPDLSKIKTHLSYTNICYCYLKKKNWNCNT